MLCRELLPFPACSLETFVLTYEMIRCRVSEYPNLRVYNLFFSPGATTPIGDYILQPSSGL